MSYILDALKKSEQERGTGKVPGVQTIHSSSLSYRSDRKTVWPYILIVAVILNLLAIIYFIVDKNKSSVIITDNNDQQTVSTDDTQPADNISKQGNAVGQTVTEQIKITQAATSSPPAIDNDPIDKAGSSNTVVAHAASGKHDTAPAQKAGISSSTVSATGNVTSTGTSGNNNGLIEFYDLPESTKKQLPAIIISAHVYSTNPLQRSIVINNNFTEEGEYVLDDLILVEVTPDGAIFDYHGTRFHYGVVSSWQ